MGFEGIVIGASAFLIIGLMHPVVIKTEYYIGTRAWPAFLVPGLILIGISLFPMPVWLAALLSILGFSLLWSITSCSSRRSASERAGSPETRRRAENNQADARCTGFFRAPGRSPGPRNLFWAGGA